MTSKHTIWYHLMALVTVSIWGTTFVSTKVLIQHGLSPVDIFVYRFVLAYVCICFLAPKRLFADSIKTSCGWSGPVFAAGRSIS